MTQKELYLSLNPIKWNDGEYTKILPKNRALVLCITKSMKNKVENFNTLKGQRWKKLAFLLSYEIYEVWNEFRKERKTILFRFYFLEYAFYKLSIRCVTTIISRFLCRRLLDLEIDRHMLDWKQFQSMLWEEDAHPLSA